MFVALVYCPSIHAGIKQVYSWRLRTNDTYYTNKSTRKGELLVANEEGPLFVAVRLKRDKELGRVTISKPIPPGSSIDPAWFAVQNNLKQLVFNTPTLSGNTYSLYTLAKEGSSEPVGSFSIPPVLGYTVDYFTDGAGSLTLTGVEASNITVRVQTFNRKFNPRVDEPVTAHLYYTAQRAFSGIIVSNLVIFQDNGKYVRVFNGLDPVNSLPRFNLYRAGTKRLKQITQPSIVAQKLEGKEGEPVILPQYADDYLYVYDQIKLETVAGPFPIPGTTDEDVVESDWITMKPRKSPKGSVLLALLLGQPLPPDPIPIVDRITLGITSAGKYTLRTYTVTATGARENRRSAAFSGVSSCELYDKRFVIIQTNQVGSIVNIVKPSNLKTTGSQPCRSVTPVVSTDRYFIDEYTELIGQRVTVYKY